MENYALPFEMATFLGDMFVFLGGGKWWVTQISERNSFWHCHQRTLNHPPIHSCKQKYWQSVAWLLLPPTTKRGVVPVIWSRFVGGLVSGSRASKIRFASVQVGFSPLRFKTWRPQKNELKVPKVQWYNGFLAWNLRQEMFAKHFYKNQFPQVKESDALYSFAFTLLRF